MSLLPAAMGCRAGCGACCVAPSLSSPIPGMPQGKPAGTRCVQLAHDHRCMIHGHPERPAVCASFPPLAEHCGGGREEALGILEAMEQMTMGGPGGE